MQPRPKRLKTLTQPKRQRRVAPLSRFAAHHGYSAVYRIDKKNKVQILIKVGITTMNFGARITYNPLQCGGKPCVRGMRIRVSDILQMLGEGVSNEEILQDFPDLEPEDIQACLFIMPLAG